MNYANFISNDHILGSKQDIEGFKNWTEKNNGMLSSQKLLDNLQFKKGDC